MSYRGDKFILRLRRMADQRSDIRVAFSLRDEPSDYGTTGARRFGTTGAGRFWRACTEHHCFFRHVDKSSVQGDPYGRGTVFVDCYFEVAF